MWFWCQSDKPWVLSSHLPGLPTLPAYQPGYTQDRSSSPGLARPPELNLPIVNVPLLQNIWLVRFWFDVKLGSRSWLRVMNFSNLHVVGYITCTNSCKLDPSIAQILFTLQRYYCINCRWFFCFALSQVDKQAERVIPENGSKEHKHCHSHP